MIGIQIGMLPGNTFEDAVGVFQQLQSQFSLSACEIHLERSLYPPAIWPWENSSQEAMARLRPSVARLGIHLPFMDMNPVFSNPRIAEASRRKLTSRGVSMSDDIELRWSQDLPADQAISLYRANGWSSADKPNELMAALAGSHRVVSAWDGSRLVGLGNALSDGHLVVYYPHLLVLPDYQGRGIGTKIARALIAKYEGFHQHILIADGRAIAFYRKLGFTRAGNTEPLWIYAGHDHE